MIPDKVLVPPIKSQGIKTKLVPHIKRVMPEMTGRRLVEPFMGTGVVGFNLARGSALMADTNPHLIRFYQAVLSGEITSAVVRQFLTEEGEKLLKSEGQYYYDVRKRFNEYGEPLDFIFLNRSCFNGMMRFNRRGGFNVPFCRKPERFAQALVTKIANQVAALSVVLKQNQFEFTCQPFVETISAAVEGDVIYCDPPYIDRHVDYFNGWDDSNERALGAALRKTKASFILSTWSHNDYRRNDYVEEVWGDYPRIELQHFYHVGANLENRGGMTEALIHSPDLSPRELVASVAAMEQAELF